MVEQEFKKQVAKEGAQSSNAKYMGYAEEPKEGEKDGKKWRKVKLYFLLDGRQKQNKFTMWSPLNSDKTKYKTDKELKQFERYHIVWYEKDESYNGKEWVDKNVVIINDESGSESNDQPEQKQNIEETDMIEIPTDEKIRKYKQLYTNKVDKEEQGENDFIGTVIRSEYPQQVEKLVKIFKEE